MKNQIKTISKQKEKKNNCEKKMQNENLKVSKCCKIFLYIYIKKKKTF